MRSQAQLGNEASGMGRFSPEGQGGAAGEPQYHLMLALISVY
jgi:hypothetical protein